VSQYLSVLSAVWCVPPSLIDWKTELYEAVRGLLLGAPDAARMAVTSPVICPSDKCAPL
jgi:hypothetical protein